MKALKQFKETLKEIKHEEVKPKFCPICNSPRLDRLSSIGIFPPVYMCRECGYKGVLTVELEKSPEV